VTNEIGLVSVNVSRPKYLGDHRGERVTSAIAKLPVTAEHLSLDRLNLEGDGQADLEVHGGPDKAVYAYASEHLTAWADELGVGPLGPAAFGENLSTTGGTEADVCIGDRWIWGDAVLEVCQPRSPCYKLAIHRGRGDIGRRLRTSGRSGWYLRVLQPGRVPVAGPITVEPHPVGATVRLVHDAGYPGGPPADVIEALLELDPLADEWKWRLAARLPD
jgi:MOSC domain-containing protein YiiM